jgi:hypothetical protein
MIRCTKCRAEGQDVLLREHWSDHVIEFDQNADGTVEPEGILLDGSPYKVIAVCGLCGHRWRLRGIGQITDLPRREERKRGTR